MNTRGGMSKDAAPGDRGPAGEPLDLPLLRQWLSSLASASADTTRGGRRHLFGKPSRSGRLREGDVQALSETLAGSLGKSHADDTLRRLLALGVVQYVKRIGHVPVDAKADDGILDVAAFALWTVAQAPDLPTDWEDTLARLTSPRMAAFVADLREVCATRDQRNFAVLHRALGKNSVAQGVRNLLEDLSDQRRGGAVLTSLALAAGLPEPDPRHRLKSAAIWLFMGVAGGAIGAEGGHVADSVNHAVDEIWDRMFRGHETHGPSSPGSHGGTLADQLIDDLFHHH